MSNTTPRTFGLDENNQIDYAQITCLEKRAHVERAKTFMTYLKKLIGGH